MSIFVSAETKRDLVQRNLREAVDAKVIEISEVFDLIRRSEENGNQHIFYFRPLTKKLAAALTFDEVGQRLWGNNWKKTNAEFPSVRLTPEDYRYSDFRLVSSRKPNDWVLKIYGHKTILRATGIKRGSTTGRFGVNLIRSLSESCCPPAGMTLTY